MKVTIYVEGGGKKNKALTANCREGFKKFFARAGYGKALRVVACGTRRFAYERLMQHLQAQSDERFAMALVDSEGPVTASSAWQHVLQRPGDGWPRPLGAGDDQLHLMVQMMEAWFFADPAALDRFYQQGFRANALHTNPKIEEIPKQDLLPRLQQATKASTKGEYSKGKHSFALLGEIDPNKVKSSSPNHAGRLFQVLQQRCS